MSKHVVIINAKLEETRPSGRSVVVVVNLLFYVHPIVCGDSMLVFLLVFITSCLSSFAIILTRKRELVALLLLSFRCFVTVNVLLLFLTVPELVCSL